MMKKFIHTYKKFSTDLILEHKSVYKLLSNKLNKLNKLKKLPTDISDYQNIYVDVSVYAKNDNNTGIQRVVREIITQLLSDNILKSRIKFILATKKIGYRLVEFNNGYNNYSSFNVASVTKFSPLVSLGSNDLFIGLDFCPNIVPSHLTTLLSWKMNGASFVWLLYDLLPISNPEWFTPNIGDNFLPWLKCILLLSNKILCISHNVEEELKKFIQNHDIKMSSATIRLGYGFTSENESLLPLDSAVLIEGDYILMVGTLEPRKAHLQILKAFDQLWQEKLVIPALVIVGKEGWLVEDLINEILCHPYYNTKIFWWNEINDGQLKQLYRKAKGVIIASYNEGYGLPLIEALTFNRAVLAREIPIFREIANEHPYVSFFHSDDNLIYDLKHWLSNLEQGLPYRLPLLEYEQLRENGWDTTLVDIKDSITKKF